MFTIVLERANEAGTRLKSLAARMDVISTATLADELEAIGAILEGEVKRRAPQGVTHDLQNHIQSELQIHGQSLEEIISAPAVAYAPVIEFGRRPGSKPPPYKQLIPWVKRKLGVSEDEAVGVAIATAKNIGKWGFLTLKYQTRQQMFQDAFDENIGRITTMLNDMGVKVSEELLKAL